MGKRYTQEEFERARLLWMDGYTYRQVARTMDITYARAHSVLNLGGVYHAGYRGYKDRKSGVALSDNPYLERTGGHREWIKGWHEMDDRLSSKGGDAIESQTLG